MGEGVMGSSLAVIVRRMSQATIVHSSTLGNSANTDLICQAKGVRPAPIPTLETNKQTTQATGRECSPMAHIYF